MFNRRARSGQCFHQPCLGTREFPARFTLIEDVASFPASTLPEDQKNRPLGWMLHDIRYLPATAADKDSFLTGQGKRVRTEPRFFNAEMKNGIIEVPPFDQAKA
jgi:CRISPR-associated protein Cas5d